MSYFTFVATEYLPDDPWSSSGDPWSRAVGLILDPVAFRECRRHLETLTQRNLANKMASKDAQQVGARLKDHVPQPIAPTQPAHEVGVPGDSEMYVGGDC